MTEIFSPSNIEFLLHCHTSCAPYRYMGAPATQECFKEFIDMGVVELDDRTKSYRTTPLGRAWVEALCRVKVPIQVYIDEQGRVLP